MQLNDTHSPKRRLSGTNDGNNHLYGQSRYRVSIPSTRASSRAVDNPLATDSLKLYADQFRCYFPEFSSYYKQLVGGFESSISGSDEGHETPCSNQGTMSSSTYSSFENSTSNSELSFRSCRSESSHNSMQSQADNLFGGLAETSEELPADSVESNGEERNLPRTCSSLSAASPETTTDKLSGSEGSRRSSSDGHLSSNHNISNNYSAKTDNSVESQVLHSPNVPVHHSTKVSFIMPFSLVAPCECLHNCSSDPTSSNGSSFTPHSIVSVGELPSFESSYKVTTLDAEQLQWMHIQVKQMCRLNSSNPLSSPSSNTSQVLHEQDNNARWQLALQSFHTFIPTYPIGWNEKQSTFWVNVTVFVNLIKPVKISLRRMSSFHSQLENMQISPNPSVEKLKNLSMFLPRGTSKQVHLHMDTTAGETVRALLDNLFIADLPHKFAIYEHYMQAEQQILVTKLPNQCSVLQHILEWAADGANYLCENVNNRRLVLQEDEPSSIEWSNFSLPELYNFLRILEMEESQYRITLQQQYEVYRRCILNAMERLKSKSTNNAQHIG